MTEKQKKTLAYADFTEAQITALSSVFNVLPPPERRKEIDGFVSRTLGKMREIDESMPVTRKIKEFRLRRRGPLPPTP